MYICRYKGTMFRHSFSYIKFYLERISPFKFVNLFKLSIGYFVSVIFRRPIMWGKPAFLSIEPTNICNLHCPECPTGGGFSSVSKGYLSFEVLNALIPSLRSSVMHVNLFFQGEPFLNKNLIEITEKISHNCLITISTNGHFITEENAYKIVNSGLFKIIVSVDGINQEQYSRYRVGGDFHKVINSIKLLKQAKGNKTFPIIEMQCLMFNYTETVKIEYLTLARSLGVDSVQFKTAQFYNKEEAFKYLPSEEYSRYVVDNDNLKIKNKLKNRCWKMWSGAVITWSGDVVPCCFDKDKTFNMGNILSTQLYVIWQHLLYRKFRAAILKNRKKISICNNCTEA